MRLTEPERQKRLIALDIQSLEKFTTKAELARILGLHRNSISAYARKAKLLYPDYKADALQYRYLSRFQCWVIWFVQAKFAENYGDTAATMADLRKARNLMTKTKFDWQQRQQQKQPNQYLGA